MLSDNVSSVEWRERFTLGTGGGGEEERRWSAAKVESVGDVAASEGARYLRFVDVRGRDGMVSAG